MSETILSISEESFVTDGQYGKDTFDGFVISTDERVIKVGISDGQSCCENYGYVTSEDDLSNFIGANLISFNWTDDELRTYDALPEYGTSTMFATFFTNKGTFQLVMYNSHNGYYGHEALIVVNDNVVERESL